MEYVTMRRSVCWPCAVLPLRQAPSDFEHFRTQEATGDGDSSDSVLILMIRHVYVCTRYFAGFVFVWVCLCADFRLQRHG